MKAELLTIIDLAQSRLRATDEMPIGNLRHDLEEIARIANSLLPKDPEWCKNCPFAKHVHWEQDGKLISNGCQGFEPSGGE
jgi:hypothetical protein